MPAVLFRILTAWLAAVGVASWSDAAAALAALYSFVEASWFIWRRFGRAACVRRGWLGEQRRRRDDYDG